MSEETDGEGSAILDFLATTKGVEKDPFPFSPLLGNKSNKTYVERINRNNWLGMSFKNNMIYLGLCVNMEVKHMY